MTQDTGLVVEINDPNDAESASLIVNRHHQVIDLHPSIEAIMAWPKADLIGHLLEELVHPEDLTALAGLSARKVRSLCLIKPLITFGRVPGLRPSLRLSTKTFKALHSQKFVIGFCWLKTHPITPRSTQPACRRTRAGRAMSPPESKGL